MDFVGTPIMSQVPYLQNLSCPWYMKFMEILPVRLIEALTLGVCGAVVDEVSGTLVNGVYKGSNV